MQLIFSQISFSVWMKVLVLLQHVFVLNVIPVLFFAVEIQKREHCSDGFIETALNIGLCLNALN